MNTRPLTPQERADIEARYGATCNLPAVTVCKPHTYSAWEDIMGKAQRQMKAARERKRKT